MKPPQPPRKIVPIEEDPEIDRYAAMSETWRDQESDRIVAIRKLVLTTMKGMSRVANDSAKSEKERTNAANSVAKLAVADSNLAEQSRKLGAVRAILAKKAPPVSRAPAPPAPVSPPPMEGNE